MIREAGGADSTRARDALASLCTTYWTPLYSFIRRQGASPHEAEDLTQEFFRQFLQRQAIRRAAPSQGKFRSFLLTCLRNFLQNEKEAANSQRRHGGVLVPLPLHAADAETCYLTQAADHLTPDAMFERRWAYAVLDRTMEKLRREYLLANKTALFEDLQGFLPGGRGTLSRTELAANRGMTVGSLDVAIHRLRRRFGDLLRKEVACTVSSESEIDGEIRHLISVLSA